MYLTFGDLQDQVIHFDRDDSPAKHTLIRSLINQYYLEVCCLLMSRHRRKTVSLFPLDEVSSGTAAITKGSRTVTLSSATPGQQYVLSSFTPQNSNRVYLVTGISGGTVTLEDPIEEDDNASATFTIRKQFFLCPDDFESWDVAVETQTPGFIFVQSREIAEKYYKQNKNTGAPTIVVDAGKNRFVTYSAGTAFISQGGTTITSVSGTPNDTRDRGRMLMFRDRPHPILITGASGSDWTIDRPWPWDSIETPGTAFEIDPVGTIQLVEFWPIPLTHSVRLWYYAKPRPMIFDHEIPSLIPEDAHKIIVQAVLEELGIRPPGGYREMMKSQVSRDRMNRPASLRIPAFGEQPNSLSSNLPSNFPRFSFFG